jgi:hypothetical protein
VHKVKEAYLSLIDPGLFGAITSREISYVLDQAKKRGRERKKRQNENGLSDGGEREVD